MFKLLSGSRQVLRASLREKEKGRGLASSQPAPPHFLFRCLLEDQEPQPQHDSTRVSLASQLCGGGNLHQLSHLLPLHSLETKEWWWNNKSKGKGSRNVHLERSLLEVLCWGGVVSLALHLFHDRCCQLNYLHVESCFEKKLIFSGTILTGVFSTVLCLGSSR